MSPARPTSSFQRGLSLIEAVIAIGVLAVVAPLAIAALVSAGDVGRSARAETRAPAIIEACLSEIRAARQSRSAHLEPILPGTAFPADNQVLCLAFDAAGHLLGKIDAAGYEKGVTELNGADILYLARISGQPDPDAPPSADPSQPQTPLFIISTRVEYPASLREPKRQGLDFVTKLP